MFFITLNEIGSGSVTSLASGDPLSGAAKIVLFNESKIRNSVSRYHPVFSINFSLKKAVFI
jgi:hypothetical protein